MTISTLSIFTQKARVWLGFAALLLLLTACSGDRDGLYVSKEDQTLFLSINGDQLVTNCLSGDLKIESYKYSPRLNTVELDGKEVPILLTKNSVVLKPYEFFRKTQ